MRIEGRQGHGGYGAGNKPGRGSLRALLHPSRAWPPPSFLRPRVHNSSSASLETESPASKDRREDTRLFIHARRR